MAKGINLVVLECKEAIVTTLNSYALPVSIKQLILNDVLNSVTRANEIQIIKERTECEASQSTEEVTE